jgi:multidrug efflux pump subunit AcrA (membrane-fusion protein)
MPESRTGWGLLISVALGVVLVVVGVPEFPQRKFAGTIASTAAGALEATSRTLLTEVRLRNDDRALMPGMYAQIKLSVPAADDVWLVPATALITRGAGSQVVSVGADNAVRYVKVDVGRDLGQSVEIVAGLTGQERLVVSPPDGLKDGVRVAVESPIKR